MIERANRKDVIRAGEEAVRIFAAFRDSGMTEEEIREEIIRAAVSRRLALDTGDRSAQPGSKRRLSDFATQHPQPLAPRRPKRVLDGRSKPDWSFASATGAHHLPTVAVGDACFRRLVPI